MKKRWRNKALDRTLWLNIALILAFFSVMSLGIYLVRDKLLYNANEMGNSLAQSYSNEEESRISVYGMFLRMCALYIDTSIDNEDPAQAMQQGLAEYTSYMSQVLGADIIDPYAVVNGKIVAAIPGRGMRGTTIPKKSGTPKRWQQTGTLYLRTHTWMPSRANGL